MDIDAKTRIDFDEIRNEKNEINLSNYNDNNRFLIEEMVTELKIYGPDICEKGNK